MVGSLIPLKSFPNFLMKKTKSIMVRNNMDWEQGIKEEQDNTKMINGVTAKPQSTVF